MDDDINIDNIDDLFEKYKDSDDRQKRAAIAETYLGILHEMCYDFSCRKLTDNGVRELMPLVDRIEMLKENISWSLRTMIYQIFMEHAETNADHPSIVTNGELAIDCLFKQLKEEKEEKYLVYGNLSMTYYTLMRYVPEEAIVNWKKAVHYIRESILIDIENANWILYFQFDILYNTRKFSPAIFAECRSKSIQELESCSGKRHL